MKQVRLAGLLNITDAELWLVCVNMLYFALIVPVLRLYRAFRVYIAERAFILSSLRLLPTSAIPSIKKAAWEENLARLLLFLSAGIRMDQAVIPASGKDINAVRSPGNSGRCGCELAVKILPVAPARTVPRSAVEPVFCAPDKDIKFVWPA